MAVGAIIIFVVALAGIEGYTVHRVRRTSAVVVIRHLTHGVYRTRVGPLTNAWSPERPPPGRRLPTGFQQMPGRGTLTYSLDPDGETVRLRWESRSGRTRDWSGPIPVFATPGYLARMHHGLAVALVAFAALAAVGAGIGQLVGSIVGGLVSGLIAGYLVGGSIWGGVQMRALREARRDMFGD